MSMKRLKQLAAVLVALLALWGLSARVLRPHHDSLGGLSLPRLSARTLDTVSIVKPGGGDTIMLARHDTTWTVNGWRASQKNVADLADALGDTAGEELVARSAAAESRLGVDSAAGYRVQARQSGRTLLDITVGKSGQQFGSAYVRPAGGSRTYLLHSNLHADVVRGVDDWRDRTITRVARDSVRTIDFGGHRAYRLQRAGKSWKIEPSGAPADSAAVAQVLGALVQLDATSFATPAEADSARFVASGPRITAVGAHADTLAALALDSTKLGYLVKSAGDSAVYRIPVSVGHELTPAESAVRKK